MELIMNSDVQILLSRHSYAYLIQKKLKTLTQQYNVGRQKFQPNGELFSAKHFMLLYLHYTKSTMTTKVHTLTIKSNHKLLVN